MMNERFGQYIPTQMHIYLYKDSYVTILAKCVPLFCNLRRTAVYLFFFNYNQLIRKYIDFFCG